MAVFKCKMCGGDLQLNENVSVGECTYCGTCQTIPKLDDDKRANLYDRANHFRRNGEFDKAADIYDAILNEDKTDAEAYWSLVLCKYGIEYVEDPRTHKRVPTCNRTQFTSIFADEDYKQALANADSLAKAVYEAEAKVIDGIQKGILEISTKEEPFDIFISYKESDQNGRRTPDSVLAQDLYYQLKHENFKVFFSRITLEDKLGTAYEPYIFAALNSSKVMVVIGTKPENFNSPWVKNEWSRYLALIKDGAKKVLIPAYRDMDPYDLPEEFSHLQAQDMSKLGFMQDLIRGIKKLISNGEPKAVNTETTIIQGNTNTASLLERAFLCLEDGEWDRADQLLEQVLNIEPKNAKAYIAKLMVELKVKEESDLAQNAKPIEESNNFQKALRFSDDKEKAILNGYNQTVLDRIENEKKEAIYRELKESLSLCKEEYQFRDLEKEFMSISVYKDSEKFARKCRDLAKQANEKDEQEQLEQKRKAELVRITTEKRRAKILRMLKISIPTAVALIVFMVLLNTVIIPAGKYSKAQDYIDEKNYAAAAVILRDLGDYKDSKQKLEPFRFYVLSTADTIEFGSYEQDNDPTNGKENITWRVLVVEKSKVLLISEKCLDCKPYNNKKESVTWETCTLRGWLNEDFLNSAFTDEEKDKILTTNVDNPDNAKYKTDGGNATSDRIFLLSSDEAKQCFASDSARQAKATPYAIARGVARDYGENVRWWLRSPGGSPHGAGIVYYGGDVRIRDDVGDTDLGARPALWINLTS